MGRHKLPEAEWERRARRPKPAHSAPEYQTWRKACVRVGRETRYCRVGEIAKRKHN